MTEPDNTFAAWINTLRPLKVTDNTFAAWINILRPLKVTEPGNPLATWINTFAVWFKSKNEIGCRIYKTGVSLTV